MTRPRRLGALLVTAVLATACSGPGGDGDRTVVAAGAAATEESVPTTTAPTTVPAPSTTSPPSPTTTRPAVTTTRPTIPPLPTTTINTTPAPPGTVSPSGPRTETGTTTSGSTTVSVTVGPLDQGPGQPVTVGVTLTTAEFPASVTLYLGDGTVEPLGPLLGAECPPATSAVPLRAQHHTYAAPGRYVIRAVASLLPCPPGGLHRLPDILAPPRTVEAAVNYQQR